MLAYELYLNQKDQEGESGLKEIPIKKVFIEKKNNQYIIKFDKKTLEEYGSQINARYQQIQTALQMPLLPYTNIEDKTTGANSPKPYISIYGLIGNDKLILSIGKKDGDKGFFEITYNLIENRIEEENGTNEVKFNLDKENYLINSKPLFEEYLHNQIITTTNKIRIPKELLKQICDLFFDYIKTKELKTKANFRLIILPEDNAIKFKHKTTETKKNQNENNIDAFGNKFDEFAEKPTKNAKFLSYDDPAFTLNQTKRKGTYQQLGIGTETLEKINLPSPTLSRAGIEFELYALDNTDLNENKQIGAGLFNLIYKHYEILKKKEGKEQKQANIKITITQRNQAKMEIISDFNMTLDHMNRILGNKPTTAPEDLFEELFIFGEGKKKNLINYLWAINLFFIEKSIKPAQLIKKIEPKLNEDILRILDQKTTKKEKIEIKQNIPRIKFCLDLFTTKNRSGEFKMNDDEHFAYATGKIAGKYIKFKKENDEKSNSLNDILTYSKYDSEQLKFIWKKTIQGLQLSKAKEENKEHLLNEIKKIKEPLKNEIENRGQDYSFFFYWGVIEEI